MTDTEFFAQNPEYASVYALVLVSALSGSTIMTMNTKNIVASAHEIAMEACRRVLQVQGSVNEQG